MLSAETETKIAKLILILAEGEKSSQITRQVLSEQTDFDPYLAFKRIDRECKNSIDEYNIVEFMKANSVYCTPNEAKFIVYLYDSNNDRSLNYSEFLNIIISENDHYLRRIAKEKIGIKYLSNVLPYDVEYSLCKVFERELDLVRNAEVALSEIKLRYDFNISEIFNNIDIKRYNYLTVDSIRNFMNRNGINLNEHDLKAAFKRMDINKDGRISFNDFRSLLFKPDFDRNFGISSFYQTKTKFNESTLDNNKIKYTCPSRINNLTKSSKYFSPRRLYSPNRSSPLKDSNQSFKKSFEKSFYNAEEDKFFEFIRNLIYYENELDRSKVDLAIRNDFNVEDSFRLFEIEGRGYITELDFKYGLNKINIFPTSEEIRLVFKRYDLNNEGILNYENFFEMISPNDKEYKRTLELRKPNNRSDVFISTTMYLFQNMMMLLISTENKVEEWRKRLNRQPGFRIKSAFDKIDKYMIGYFVEHDLITYFNKYSISYLNKDIELLLGRFDKDRDGIVNYSEFNSEIYPNSP